MKNKTPWYKTNGMQQLMFTNGMALCPKCKERFYEVEKYPYCRECYFIGKKDKRNYPLI